MSDILKVVLQDGLNLAVADKAQELAFITPVLDNLANGAVEEATKLANEIPNIFLKTAVLAAIAKYGPELPALINQYEGDAFDKVAAFLQAEINKLPN